jgi:predicted DNA-binding transcriptional regulator YafY
LTTSPPRAQAGARAAIGRGPARLQQRQQLVMRGGRWYVVAWEPRRADWRIYRADRIIRRTPNGSRFTRHEIPGGDVGAFVSSRFNRPKTRDEWPCVGEVILDLPVADVIPFAGDGVVQPVGPDRCHLRLGAWSWPGLAAALARFDVEIEVLDPPELRTAFAHSRSERPGPPRVITGGMG